MVLHFSLNYTQNQWLLLYIVGPLRWSLEKEWQPTPVFLLEEFHGQRSLVSYSPWESQRVGHDWVTNAFPGGAVGKESAYQCRTWRRCRFDPWVRNIPWRRKWQPTPVFLLGNPVDRGAWQATVHGVAKSRTWLNDFPFPFFNIPLCICTTAFLSIHLLMDI